MCIQAPKEITKSMMLFLPWNNYAWSKLGGECAVQMYKNSLILRVCMTEKPFIHNKAFTNVKLNFIFHEESGQNFG